MHSVELVELVAIGLAAGSVGGMLGIGGSIIMIPAMTMVLGPAQHLYQATAMIVAFFVTTPAVVQHARARAIQPSTVKKLLPMALVGVLAGVGLSELPIFAGRGEAHLRALFGVFLLVLCLVDLYRLIRPRMEAEALAGALSWRTATSVSLPTGVVAGLFGIGGGVLAVPLQRRFLGIPMPNAIANSASLIIMTSMCGAFVKNYAYYFDHGGSLRPLSLAAALIPTAMIGGTIGSRLTHRIPVRNVKTAFFVLLAIAAVRMILGALRSMNAGM